MDSPSSNPPSKPSGSPEAVVLQPRTEGNNTDTANGSPNKSDQPIHLAKRSFKPSHKATFIALIVISVLLLATVGSVIFIVSRGSKTKAPKALSEINVNKSVLDQLGVNRSSSGDASIALVVSPNAQFNGTLTVSKDVKIGTKLTAGQTSLTGLDAGNTSLTQLNVNGPSSLSDTNVRTNLSVTGTTRLQGPVTLEKLLTILNGVNITGDLTVGGTLTTNNFTARSLTSTSTLTVGGHVITNGPVPGISQGSAPGPSGTVSISGNDASGTIAMNTGQAPLAGIIASITFRTPYGNTPRVIVSASSPAAGSLQFYVNRSPTGFTLGTNNPPVAASVYVFDYIVQQ